MDVPARTAVGDVAAGKAAGGEGERGPPLRMIPRDCRGGRRSRGRGRAGHPWARCGTAVGDIAAHEAAGASRGGSGARRAADEAS